MDTIAAIATPVGTGGIGVIRVSGPEAFAIADRLFTPCPGLVKAPQRQMRYGHVCEGDRHIDEALLLAFPGPKSFTTEDVVEFQCHGGLAVLRKVLSLCLRQGARLAAPGEFTKRAFLGGRLDLTQAEAIGDLIEAKSERALENAISQMDGALSQKLNEIRSHLLNLLARLEASIDYPDEIEDLEDLESPLMAIQSAIRDILKTADEGRILREGVTVALTGSPNVGKSSLLNTLLGTDRAIVTDIPGTTRDVIEEQLQLQGWWFRILDTAGIRDDAQDAVEQIGIERSHRAVTEADVALVLVDATQPPAPVDWGQNKARILVANKIDLLKTPQDQLDAWEAESGQRPIGISALHGKGIEDVQSALVRFAEGASPLYRFAINARHQGVLLQAEEAIRNALDGAKAGLAHDLVAIDLGTAAQALGEISGETISEQVLDRIFANYCVGK